MKILLLALLSLTVVGAFAAEEDAPVAEAEAKATPKAGAKDKAKVKAKKGKPKAAAVKKDAFASYDAGPWKPVNNRKGHLFGFQLSDGDLVRQPVLVMKFDPAVEVSRDARESDPKYVDFRFEPRNGALPRFQFVNVPARELTNEEAATLPKLVYKTAAIPNNPWYADLGLVQEPKNPGGALPFYYVVDAENKVVYAGGNGNQALAALNSAARKAGTPDPMLGYVKPTVHADLCAGLKFGQDITKIVAKLKPIATKGSGEAKDEADAILKALDQSKTYALKNVIFLMGSQPQQSLLAATQAMKTFPRARQDLQAYITRLNANPAIQKTFRIYKDLSEVHVRLQPAEGVAPMKKAEIKKAYQQALVGERLCSKARKEYGDKLPSAFVTFEDLVQTVKAELEAAGATEK